MKKKEAIINRKSLVVTTVASTLDQFCMNDIKTLQKSTKVYVAANFNTGNNTSKERVKEFKSELKKKGIIFNEINMNRNPFNMDNLSAYQDIKKLIEENHFHIIHCHTPVAAMLVRIAARKVRENGTKVIYTAHGFHFYNGAPIKNWLIYYPVERWLSKYTDVLITINQEDYERARSSFNAIKTKSIPGVGIDTEKFNRLDLNRELKRQEIGLPKKSFVVLSVGELNNNKNHETVIKAISRVNNPNVYYVICGQGALEDYLRKLIQDLGMEKQIKLLGFRNDVAEIYRVADIFAFPSFREGLSVALMEAMASGLPIICSKIRGNVDLVKEQKGGYLIKPEDVNEYHRYIKQLINDADLRSDMGLFNKEYLNEFDNKKVKQYIDNIYKECI
ncbi:glycosyltransferase family 4 protein [Sporosarcina sp. G11-34]|nr:glycosyltransferase family 4 protein [Sporosarcina sp. G11-34]